MSDEKTSNTNTIKIATLEGKVSVILLITGSNFMATVALIITLLSS